MTGDNGVADADADAGPMTEIDPLEGALSGWLSGGRVAIGNPRLASLLAIDIESFEALRHFVRNSPLRAREAARTVLAALAEEAAKAQSAATNVGSDARNDGEANISPDFVPAGEETVVDILAVPSIEGAVRRAEMQVLAMDDLEEVLAALSPWESLGAHTRGSALAAVYSEGLGALSDLVGRTDELRRIARLLGRIDLARRGPERQRRIGRERVEGVTFGNDPADILTSELSLLGDPATEPLFDLRFVERKLFQLEWSGNEPGGHSEPRKTAPRGPLIIAIDTSASMTGDPVALAKAAALALVRDALRGRRLVHVLLFGGRDAMVGIDFEPGSVDFNGLFRFLASSFSGGTDYAGPIRRALRLRSADRRFVHADLAIVSDGIAAIPVDLVTTIQRAKADGMRLGAIAILRPGRDPGVLADLADPLEKLETGAFSV